MITSQGRLWPGVNGNLNVPSEDYNGWSSVIYRASNLNVGTRKLMIGHDCPIVCPINFQETNTAYVYSLIIIPVGGVEGTRVRGEQWKTKLWLPICSADCIAKKVKHQATITMEKKWQTQYDCECLGLIARCRRPG